MQFIDLKAQYKRIKISVNDRINAVLEHGKFIMGPEVKELEEKLARFTGAEYCVSCSSGTDALLLALMAYDIGPGDAVFTSPFTFIATAEVISLLGATPIFVDINPETYNIDPDKLQKTISDLKNGKKPTAEIPDHLTLKAVIPVDLFGLPADYDAINRIAKEHGLVVIEDAAQGFGATYKGKKACNLADIAATSFFPAKPLGCYGDGGAVFTNDKDISDKLVSLRVHGKGNDKYDNVRVGLNGRCDTLQAAILLSKMEVFAEEIGLRQSVAQRYSEGLSDVVKVPFIPEGYESAWAQYSILSDSRQELMDRLKENGIPTAIYYPKPLHLQTAYAYLGYQEGSMPVSEEVSQKIFSLPMHPYLNEEDQGKIIEIIKNI
jgi:UDP-2-acetamido-2-deoxy-ribo-hexuluronate aminotransferase